MKRWLLLLIMIFLTIPKGNATVVKLTTYDMKTCKYGHEKLENKQQCKICSATNRKKFREKNKEYVAEQQRIYRKENKENLYIKYREWYEGNHEKITEKQSLYRKKNSKNRAAYVKEKKKTDIVFNLSRNLRSRIGHILKNKSKSGSAVRDLGCTGEELKQFLESKFQEGMTWDNYGNKEGQWSIDHVIPLSKVDLTNREEFLKVNNYTNLRPMWHIDNLKKGNRMITYEEITTTDKAVLRFTATWCPPCKALAPIFDEVAGEHPEMKTFVIDVDKEPEIASKFGIKGIPTLMRIEKGSVKMQKSGARPKPEVEEFFK